MSDTPDYAREFSVDLVWAALQTMLTNDLGNAVDVDCIGSQDFDEDGALTIVPPAARVLFLEESLSAIENQKLNYEADLRFAVICADQDLGPDPQTQRSKSIALAGRVKHSLTGARIDLGEDSVSEPIEYLGMKPLPTANLGMAYVPAFKVSGLAYFAGPNATTPTGDV